MTVLTDLGSPDPAWQRARRTAALGVGQGCIKLRSIPQPKAERELRLAGSRLGGWADQLVVVTGPGAGQFAGRFVITE